MWAGEIDGNLRFDIEWDGEAVGLRVKGKFNRRDCACLWTVDGSLWAVVSSRKKAFEESRRDFWKVSFGCATIDDKCPFIRFTTWNLSMLAAICAANSEFHLLRMNAKWKSLEECWIIIGNLSTETRSKWIIFLAFRERAERSTMKKVKDWSMSLHGELWEWNFLKSMSSS